MKTKTRQLMKMKIYNNTKLDFGWGSAPDLGGGVHSTLQTP